MQFTESQSMIVSISIKTVALALVIFVGGMVSGIVLYPLLINTESEQMLQESLDLSDQHVWWNQDGWAEATVVVINVGEKGVTLEKITIKGLECLWSNIYYWKTDTGPISNELEPTPTVLSGSQFVITVDDANRTFQQATTALTLTLERGYTTVLYIKDPDNITSKDIDSTVVISIFTENKIYYEDTVVEIPGANAGQQAGVLLKKDAPCLWQTGNITIYVRNTGTSDAEIDAVYINSEPQSTVLYNPAKKIVEKNGGSITITVTKSWTSGTRYYFQISPKLGEPLSFEETSP